MARRTCSSCTGSAGKAALANKDYVAEVSKIASGYANNEKSRMKKAAKAVLKQLGEK